MPKTITAVRRNRLNFRRFNPNFIVTSLARTYFGNRLLTNPQDRLGSIGKYYPYGEERNYSALPNDQVKFATYTRDGVSGLDYADQRYYTSQLGRFMTPDPL